jgi:uncharacterized protein YegP (UPF0339 family)
MTKTTLKLETYQDGIAEWRWRLIRNGRVVCDSGEGYKRRSTMLRTIKNLARDISKVDLK